MGCFRKHHPSRDASACGIANVLEIFHPPQAHVWRLGQADAVAFFCAKGALTTQPWSTPWDRCGRLIFFHILVPARTCACYHSHGETNKLHAL